MQEWVEYYKERGNEEKARQWRAMQVKLDRLPSQPATVGTAKPSAPKPSAPSPTPSPAGAAERQREIDEQRAARESRLEDRSTCGGI